MDTDDGRSDGTDLGPGGSRSPSFEFAFNSVNFSDRVLRIEVMPDPPGTRASCAHDGSIAEWAKRKRRCDELKRVKESRKNAGEAMSSNIKVIKILDYDTDEDNHTDDAVVILEESDGGPDDDYDEQRVENPCSTDCSKALRVKTIYISSAILAAKSPFFYKLFSNGMKESEQRQANLRITESEENALMELLSFMYSGKLSSTTSASLLDVLMVADKYQVASCVRYCSQMLRVLPMTTESALLYLDLPVSTGSTAQPLSNAAKEFLADKYKDLIKFQDEVMNLPLAGIEAILSSSDLQVASEDAVYDLVLKWARAHYPRLDKRREVLGSRLLPLVRFAHMTCRKLKKVLTCNDLAYEAASKLVIDALIFKASAHHRQRTLAAEEATSQQFAERIYKHRPVKVVEFDRPFPQCIAFMDLKREECTQLFPSGRIYSQAFHFAWHGFFLSAHCNVDQQSANHCFGLFLGMQEKGATSVTVDYEFSVRTNPAGEFVSKYKGSYTFTGGKAVGYRNLFAIPWKQFMAEDSIYFMDGTLHLRAELTIKPPS